MYILKYKFYDDCIQLSYYKKRSSSIRSGSSYSSNSEQSKLSRSCSRIKDIILSNDFDYFVTLTSKTALEYSKETSINLFNTFVSNYRKLCKFYNVEFKYVYVFEKTKNGGIHLHGFFKGFYDLYENQYGYLSSHYFDKLGFQCIEKATDVNPYYLIKYITKEPCYIKQVYHCSRGLKRPKVEYYHDHFNKFLDLPFKFNNGFCKMTTYEK